MSKHLRTKLITQLNHTEARKFFLSGKNYCNIDLPSYFNFEPLLKAISQNISGENLSSLSKNGRSDRKIYEYDDVNYLLYANKDGNLSWRPLQIIHPLVYVAIIHKITKEENWEKLCKLFKKSTYGKISCVSIPVQSQTKQSDKAEQILSWWEHIEQESIYLSMQYDYMAVTDITDCYASIYTHSIAWAIEGKDTAKNNRDTSLLGNYLDKIIQNAQYGQTNGIPQGSVLMDFIAEIILNSIDVELYENIKKDNGITNYKILRYRDDYRIFTKSEEVAKKILKKLSDVLMVFGLKLNSNKTNIHSDIITNSIKKDKIAYKIRGCESYTNIQDHVLAIYQHSLLYPNSGSLVRLLNELHQEIKKHSKSIKGKKQIISILVDIGSKNPRVISLCVGIISFLLSKIKDNEQENLIDLIINKFKNNANSELSEVWIQRLLIKNSKYKDRFDKKLCLVVNDPSLPIWNNDWISWTKYQKIIKDNPIIDQQKINQLDEVIDNSEIQIFRY